MHEPFDATAAAADAAMPATGTLPTPASRRVALLTCTDPRIVPHELFGLRPGDVEVLRNAGGRVTPDVVRTLVFATRLHGVEEVVVVHHTDCASSRSDRELTVELREAGVGGELPPLHGAPNPVTALRADLEALRADALLPDDLRVAGYRYDLESGAVVPLAALEGIDVA